MLCFFVLDFAATSFDMVLSNIFICCMLEMPVINIIKLKTLVNIIKLKPFVCFDN